MPKITLDHSHILSNDVGTIWEKSVEGHLREMKIIDFSVFLLDFLLKSQARRMQIPHVSREILLDSMEIH